MVKKVLFYFSLVFVFLVSAKPLFAASGNLSPSGGSYLVKRLTEKIQVAYLGVLPQKKAGFYNKLVERRFAELTYVYENKLENDIEKSAQRYFTTVGKATEFMEGKGWNQSTKLVEILNEHEPKIEALVGKTEYNSAPWLLLQQDLGYLRSYRSRL